MKKQKLKRKDSRFARSGIARQIPNYPATRDLAKRDKQIRSPKFKIKNGFKIQNLKFKQIPASAGMTGRGCGNDRKIRE